MVRSNGQQSEAKNEDSGSERISMTSAELDKLRVVTPMALESVTQITSNLADEHPVIQQPPSIHCVSYT